VNVKIDRSFERDTKKIKDRKLLDKLADIIEQIQNSSNTTEIKNLKKIVGAHSYYRIKMGDFRIGISIEEGSVILIRFLSRKDIYKHFP
jgi:mRNA interferase RelE/StbE